MLTTQSFMLSVNRKYTTTPRDDHSNLKLEISQCSNSPDSVMATDHLRNTVTSWRQRRRPYASSRKYLLWPIASFSRLTLKFTTLFPSRTYVHSREMTPRLHRSVRCRYSPRATTNMKWKG